MMKTITIGLALVILGLQSVTLLGQQGDGRPENAPGPRGDRGEGGPAGFPPGLQVLDVNGNGVLEAREINRARRSLLTLDTDGDGRITLDELRAAGRQQAARQSDERRPERPERPQAAERPERGDRPERPRAGERPDRPMLPAHPILALFDTNRDGIIDETELNHASKILAALDRSGDGKVTVEDLRAHRAERMQEMRRGGAGADERPVQAREPQRQRPSATDEQSAAPTRERPRGARSDRS